jgi:hypothetical protein
MSVPSAPQVIYLPDGRNESMKFYWVPPSSGSPITNYTLSCTNPPITCNTGPTSNYAYTVLGLSNGTSYTFSITADNSNGTSPSTLFQPAIPGVIPSSPLNQTYSLVNSNCIHVQWSTPTTSGGAPIYRYGVWVYPVDASNTPQSNLAVKKYTYNNVFSTLVNVPYSVYSSNYKFIVRAITDADWSPNNVSDYISVVNNTFNPQLLSSLSFWLDATDSASYTTSGNNVLTWTDKSSNAYVFSSVTTNYPTLSTISTNTAIHFTGASNLNANTQRMINANVSTVTSSFTIYSVARKSPSSLGSGGYNYILRGNVEKTIAFGTSNNNFTTFAGNTSIWFDTAGNTPTSSVLSTSILGMTISTNVLTPYYNTSPMNTKNGGLAAFSGFVIGDAPAAANTGTCWNGQIGEILMYNQTLSLFDRQKIEGYLGWKWGLQNNLPSTHPYKVSSPTNLNSFIPKNLEGLGLWLDGNDPLATGSLPSDGATVSSWVDKSGASNSTATGAGTITYSLTTNGLVFNGSSQYTTNLTASSLIQSAFIVWRKSATTVTHTLLGPSATAGRQFRYNDSTGRFDTVKAGISETLNTSYPVTNGVPLLAEYICNTNSLTHFVNGSSIGSVANPTSYNATLTTQIGASASSERLTGTIHEIVVYNSTLTQTNREYVEGYLAWRWGLESQLPSSHPFKNSAPIV